jgi:DNA repair protein RadC
MQTQLVMAAKPIPRLKLLSEEHTPSYRVSTNPRACTSIELLSVLIGGQYQMETAEQLLARFGGELVNVYRASVDELAAVKGIGHQTALKIKAAFSLSLAMNTTSERAVINSPADAAALVHAEMSLLEKEHLRTILLDRRNRVIEIAEIYVGSVSSAQVRLGEVFNPAIRRNASAMIVVHNHPSGDPTPSPDDVAVTRALVTAGNMLDISVLDHLIIGKTWKSLKESGLGFS